MKLIVFPIALLCFCFSMLQAQNQASIKVACTFLSEDSLEIEKVKASLNPVESIQSIAMSQGVFIVPQKGSYTMQVNALGFLPAAFTLQINGDTSFVFVLTENVVQQQNFIVRTVNAREKSGFVFTNLSAKQISRDNLGQDFTYLLGNTPSAVSTSDAGSGVGYTGIRIRGSDATRINVTINSIPINDAESHGVFWVNMPDLASSTSSVQVQRGVGSSTVGTGAFGANINISNTGLSAVPFVQMQQSIGSFNTSKSSLLFGTGNLNKFNFSGRLSKIRSDGYVDRASSDLQAFQFNLNYTLKKWNLQAVSFGGKEKTYQSWYGTPESRVKGDLNGMLDYAERNYLSEAEKQRLLNSSRTYNYYTYNNQTDNYWQNHYQLHFSGEISPALSLKSSLFATTGKGFYEEFKEGASYAAYGVSDYISNGDTVSNTNLVRQRWLDNLYVGSFTSLNYKDKKNDAILGLGYTQYTGNHFGDVIWAEIAKPFGKDYRYYQSKSKKSEFNTFIKFNRQVSKKLQADAEIQWRQISYTAKGNDNDLKTIGFDTSYTFINPKLGLVYSINSYKRFYSSYSVGRREPVRSDFIDNSNMQLPKPEYLQDFELGYIYKKKETLLQFNFYHMDYKNQLVVTGELNDVGSSLRRNVDKSFRQGIELVFQKELVDKLLLEGNLNLSRNKIVNFKDIYYNYDSGSVITDNYKMTDIAFSPSVIGYIGLRDTHLKQTELALNCKYVGKQYLDNTLNKSRALDAYYTLNFSVQKQINLGGKSVLNIKGMVNNMTGTFYSNNGYTYKYIYSGKLITENFLYPQSPMNFMLGIDFKFL